MTPQLLHSNELLISYSQLAVYNSGSDQPFPDWSHEDLPRAMPASRAASRSARWKTPYVRWK